MEYAGEEHPHRDRPGGHQVPVLRQASNVVESSGAVYYSANLAGLYQAAQNMSKNHLCKHCRLLPADIKKKLTALRRSRRRAGGGKCYWAEGATKLGIVQTKDGLRFATSVNNTSTIVAEGREGKQKEK
eukprot:CAMPEP_0198112404 /NCGR_PEP_ID=MMETSP1442-20131203/4261_1 /TAXON_ID= /ORGANISM="Craspedostauros australis, Strain CCMP3328" /LENGTH=128 /DNA_ID=CAMNT_0043769157 /DNA_START=56 /DNA_END=443 /DNA_ORIENTATION=+